MAFCRECGKEIQDDWNSCPFCKADIRVSNVQDSVVMGDIVSTTNVNYSVIEKDIQSHIRTMIDAIRDGRTERADELLELAKKENYDLSVRMVKEDFHDEITSAYVEDLTIYWEENLHGKSGYYLPLGDSILVQLIPLIEEAKTKGMRIIKHNPKASEAYEIIGLIGIEYQKLECANHNQINLALWAAQRVEDWDPDLAKHLLDQYRSNDVTILVKILITIGAITLLSLIFT